MNTHQTRPKATQKSKKLKEANAIKSEKEEKWECKAKNERAV
jgi:hypothetical protein